MGNNVLRIVFWLGVTFLFLHLAWSCGNREQPEGQLDYTAPDSIQSEARQEQLGIDNELQDTLQMADSTQMQ